MEKCPCWLKFRLTVRLSPMSASAKARLTEERKDWRKSRPFGFVAKPRSAPDGSFNLLLWDCIIPGKQGTDWEGGLYPVQLIFSGDYPSKAPTAVFPPGFLHPNIYPDGHVCLSILNDDADLGGGWAPSLTVCQILCGIQNLLSEPNLFSAAQDAGHDLLKKHPRIYAEKVREQALRYAGAKDDD